MPVAARFFGGPKDGETIMLEAAPWQLYFNQPADRYWTPGGVRDVVPERTIIYQRTGPVAAGTADYQCVEP